PPESAHVSGKYRRPSPTGYCIRARTALQWGRDSNPEDLLMHKCLIFMMVIAAGGLLAVTGCSRQSNTQHGQTGPAPAVGPQTPAMPASASPEGMINEGTTAPAATTVADLGDPAFVARFTPLNSNITGSRTTGSADIFLSGDEMTIRINITGAPP